MCSGWLVLCLNIFTLVKSSVGLPNVQAGKTINYCDMLRVLQGCQTRSSKPSWYLQASVLGVSCLSIDSESITVSPTHMGFGTLLSPPQRTIEAQSPRNSRLYRVTYKGRGHPATLWYSCPWTAKHYSLRKTLLPLFRTCVFMQAVCSESRCNTECNEQLFKAQW